MTGHPRSSSSQHSTHSNSHRSTHSNGHHSTHSNGHHSTHSNGHHSTHSSSHHSRRRSSQCGDADGHYRRSTSSSHHRRGRSSHSSHHDDHSSSSPTSCSSSTKQAFRECLSALGLPHGLLSSVLSSYESCDSRLWLLDNSSSMKQRDSHVGRGSSKSDDNSNCGVPIVERLDNVTRWEELEECVSFHAKMASRCWIPTKYWLVNDEHDGHHKFSLCWSHHKDVPSEMATVKKALRNATCDQSQCPLAHRLASLAKGISKEEPNLTARDRHVTLVICTQGLPTDKSGNSSSTLRREFQHALVGFGKLPVKVIVRLCTDDEKVRDMFNTMDSRFENVDVLDDFWGEAMEVYLHNSWLTYSMGLHRLREAGLAPEVIDDLDERPLTLDELHEFCTMLFVGEDGRIDLPHPTKSWSGFFRALKVLVEKEKPQWNPVKKKLMPWINLTKLESLYGKKDRGGGGHHRHSSRHGSESSHGEDAHHESSGGHHYHRGTSSGSSHGQDPSSSGRQRRHTVHSNARRGSDDPPQDNHTHHRDHSRQHSQQRRGSVDPMGGGSEHSSSHQQQPRQRRHTHVAGGRTAAAAPPSKDLTLTEVLKHWSTRPPSYENPCPLEQLLVTVPQTFPPTNTKVEPHEYFAKWKTFDEEAFADESGDELKELLKRAVRKAKFFLHPDKLPKDLTENQTLLFKTIWDVLQESEAATLG